MRYSLVNVTLNRRRLVNVSSVPRSSRSRTSRSLACTQVDHLASSRRPTAFRSPGTELLIALNTGCAAAREMKSPLGAIWPEDLKATPSASATNKQASFCFRENEDIFLLHVRSRTPPGDFLPARLLSIPLICISRTQELFQRKLEGRGRAMRHKCHESLGRVSVVTNALGVQCYSSLERVTYGTSGPGLRRVRDIAEQVPVLAQGAQTSNGVRVNMVDESRPAVTESGWQAKHAYAMAVVCLLLGLLAGYLLRGSESSKAAAAAAAGAAPATPVEAPTQQMPTLEQMKRMADRTAEPLLTKLQSDPKNAALLAQIGKVYESAHQFKEAADYYGKSLEIDPTSVANRNAMASCLYYNGDADGAIAQLEQSLRGD